uniref:ATP synthase I chain n=1 Tax=Candidatus Kentrum sp. FM TaxID=2126340 RepID=A0A450RZM0_9GAMM|nr:MAG: ATP synthase I chain [Candidatus Kentron sp. FM]VFJ44586.1 MAG: ATP synthase I chain [Candidatus Kentron sp. FM]VFK06532.1 MAG: ATP synthase I chain [Candidatus Kentron sp. FM]
MSPHGNQCSSRYLGSISGPIAQSDQIKLLLGLQVVLILVVGVAYLIASGSSEALSAVYGASMAAFSTWMLARRVRFATQVAKDRPGQEVGVLYSGAIQRFVFILILFIIGIAVLAFEPVPLLIGFTVPQGAFLLGSYFLSSHLGCR